MVPAGSRYPQQVALAGDAQLRMLGLDQRPPLGKRPKPFFRSQSTSTLSWPICW
jgi:hypothetical protein